MKFLFTLKILVKLTKIQIIRSLKQKLEDKLNQLFHQIMKLIYKLKLIKLQAILKIKKKVNKCLIILIKLTQITFNFRIINNKIILIKKLRMESKILSLLLLIIKSF